MQGNGTSSQISGWKWAAENRLYPRNPIILKIKIHQRLQKMMKVRFFLFMWFCDMFDINSTLLHLDKSWGQRQSFGCGELETSENIWTNCLCDWQIWLSKCRSPELSWHNFWLMGFFQVWTSFYFVITFKYNNFSLKNSKVNTEIWFGFHVRWNVNVIICRTQGHVIDILCWASLQLK